VAAASHADFVMAACHFDADVPRRRADALGFVTGTSP
jgi:hypothetical protein